MLHENKISIWQMNRVRRWHAFPGVIGEQTTADHSWGVAAIICQITNPSVELLKAALFHDTPEYYTGDMPYQSKRDWTGLRKEMALAERDVYNYLENVHKLPPALLTEEEQKILKWADMCELAFFAKHQVQLGNSYMLDMYVEVVERTLIPNCPGRAAEELIYTHFMVGGRCNGRK